MIGKGRKERTVGEALGKATLKPSRTNIKPQLHVELAEIHSSGSAALGTRDLLLGWNLSVTADLFGKHSTLFVLLASLVFTAT